MTPPVLDPCCGSRMMWHDHQRAGVVYGDCRRETRTVTDNSKGNASGVRVLRIEPDMLLDFRNLPFDDGTFVHVVFDPPHLISAGPKSWLAVKYGRLDSSWQQDIRQGFSECWRVLCPGGTLVFKWNETQVKLREVLQLAPQLPHYGHTSGHKGLTHWQVFIKDVAQ